jgi:hypothetical protein
MTTGYHSGAWAGKHFLEGATHNKHMCNFIDIYISIPVSSCVVIGPCEQHSQVL